MVRPSGNVTGIGNQAGVVSPLNAEGFFYGAPGRAHLLGGGSPLLARQGEELAERQGCREQEQKL